MITIIAIVIRTTIITIIGLFQVWDLPDGHRAVLRISYMNSQNHDDNNDRFVAGMGDAGWPSCGPANLIHAAFLT